MEVLDAQLHCWLSDRPSRPWVPEYRQDMRQMLSILQQVGPPMPPETLLCEMAAAGVDGGVLTPQGVYGDDNNLELRTAGDYPRKFVVIGWVDHRAPDVNDVLARDVHEGMVGVRLLRMDDKNLAAGDFDVVLRFCDEHELAVSFILPHPVPKTLEAVFERYQGIRFLIDHLGVGHIPPVFGLAPMDPWELLPDVLAVARHPNLYFKLTGAVTLSHEPYPYRDLWDGILRIIDAFGPERVLWGSDITRAGSLTTYADATQYLHEITGITRPDLELIYGQALRKVLRWEPEAYLLKRTAGNTKPRGSVS